MSTRELIEMASRAKAVIDDSSKRELLEMAYDAKMPLEESTFEFINKVHAKYYADAARYKWLRNCRELNLRTDGSQWLTPDGRKFVCSHRLECNGTRHAPQETLEETIDAAMKLCNEAI